MEGIFAVVGGWWLVVVGEGEGERVKRRGEAVFFLCDKKFWRGKLRG